MRWIQQVVFKMRAIFWRSRVEREMDAELASHLEAETRALVRSGMDPAQARSVAVNTMGHMALLREQCRDARGTAWSDRLRQDLTFAIRLFLKNRTFTFTALVTLALAIGSTTAVFTLLDHVLLRPLPFAAP